MAPNKNKRKKKSNRKSGDIKRLSKRNAKRSRKLDHVCNVEINGQNDVEVIDSYIELNSEADLVKPVGNLYEQALFQWQLSDWEGLANLTYDVIVHDQNRAKLAVLAASGYLQQENYRRAKQYINLAKKWGASNTLIGNYLVASVHDCLGRAYAICDDEKKAVQHFKTASIFCGQSSLSDLYSQSRFIIHRKKFYASLNEIKEKDKQIAARAVIVDEKEIRVNAEIIDELKSKIPEQDFCNRLFDIDSGVLPKHILILLSTPRSGSTMLCDILLKNDICIPHEYFQPYQYMPLLAIRWDCVVGGVLNKDKYIEELIKHRTFKNGLLGINLHGSHISIFMKMYSLLKARGCIFHYIHLKRKDIVAQAVSLDIASKDGLWTKHFSSVGKAKVEYDFQSILGKMRMIEGQNILIESFLHDCEHHAIELIYEEMVNDYGKVEKLLSSIVGRNIELKHNTKITKQNTGQKNRWISRFMKDYVTRKSSSPSL